MGLPSSFRRGGEGRGLLVVPGPATNRNAFLSIHDAARLMTAAVPAEDVTGAPDVGGPEVLSWQDVACLYGEVVCRPVRVVSLPPAAFAVAQRLLAPISPAAPNIMGMNVLLATTQSDWDTRATTDRLGVTHLRTVREVLAENAALPARARIHRSSASRVWCVDLAEGDPDAGQPARS